MVHRYPTIWEGLSKEMGCGLPRLTLVDDEPAYRQSLTLRGLKALAVTF